MCVFFFQPSSQVGKSKISPSSDEYVLDQLSVCEEKLLKVLEDLDATGKDLGELNKQMEEEEVCGYLRNMGNSPCFRFRFVFLWLYRKCELLHRWLAYAYDLMFSWKIS